MLVQRAGLFVHFISAAAFMHYYDSARELYSAHE